MEHKLVRRLKTSDKNHPSYSGKMLNLELSYFHYESTMVWSDGRPKITVALPSDDALASDNALAFRHPCHCPWHRDAHRSEE